jgi:hypothetical protein
MDKIEGRSGYFVTPWSLRLCNNCSCRGGISIATSYDCGIERGERFVYQQRIVHISTCRAYIYDDLLSLYILDFRYFTTKFFVGSDTLCVVRKLTLLGYAYNTFDIDGTYRCIISNFNFCVLLIHFRRFFCRKGKLTYAPPFSLAPSNESIYKGCNNEYYTHK